MRVYTSNPRRLEEAEKMISLQVGMLVGPYTSFTKYPRMVAAAGLPVAVDNGAYGAFAAGRGFDEYGFLKILNTCAKENIVPAWVVCPDIVAGGERSLDFSLRWRDRLPGWLLYLAVQDGMDPKQIDLSGWAGVFVGGSTKWKWQTARTWVLEAHRVGLPCHIGRTPSVTHLKACRSVGADSCDSTNFQRNGYWNNIQIAREEPKQVDLPGASASGRLHYCSNGLDSRPPRGGVD